MASGTLYTYPENFRAYKALIAAQFSGAQVKVAQDFKFGETNKSDAFLKKFPLGKVPAFETSDGTCITESNAIAYYVSNDQLRGKTDLERAQVLQWFGFADSEILPASSAWVFPLLGIMPYNEEAIDNAKEDVHKVLTSLNSHLLTRTYLVGERLTVADISVAMTLLYLYQYILEPNLRQPYQNVTRWFQTVINQPESIAVIGTFKFADKTLVYDPLKIRSSEGRTQSADVENVQAENEVTEEVEAEKKPFHLDDWKRVYSNEVETKSIPYFWKHFDPTNFSIWYSEYKYPTELTKVFMSCNLIGGMFQRLDNMRKVAFASVCLFGGDCDSSISGIWVWQGQDLIFSTCASWAMDYESYHWVKLDPSDEETKKKVEQYFSWTGTDEKGRKFNQGKIFK